VHALTMSKTDLCACDNEGASMSSGRTTADGITVDPHGLPLRRYGNEASAGIMDWDGIKMLLCQADVPFARLKLLWPDSAYRGEDKGKDWV
jgi:hypothetical protein